MDKKLSKKALIITIIISVIVVGICAALIIINSNKLSNVTDKNTKSAEDQIEKWKDLRKNYLGD